jgi:hypothetical protein
MEFCNAVIDLSRPIRSERRRQFQPPYYTVFVYRCTCGHEVTVRASAYSGTRAVPSRGGIVCGGPVVTLGQPAAVRS